jgi:superfamily II DNA helicase RecQ
MTWIDELLESHRLRQFERNGYPVLSTTLSGRAEAEAWLAEHPELAGFGPAPDTPTQTAGEDATAPAEADIYTSLQKAIWLWRRRYAEQSGQPPYMVITNEIILRIAELRPRSTDELGALPGMGPQRLTHYGGALLDLVHLYPAEPGDTDKLAAQRANPTAPGPRLPVEPPSASQASPRAERQIYARLQELRQKIAVRERSKPYLIANNTLLRGIAHNAPTTLADLERIPGFRSSGLRAYADQIIALIAAGLAHG